MARPSISTVHTAVRSMIDDRDTGSGVVWTDNALLPISNMVQRRIYRELRNRGLEDGMATTTLQVDPGDPGFIDWTTALGKVLPDDFVRPETIWEKPLGDPDTSYVQMSNVDERLPDEDPANEIRYWVWEDNETNQQPRISFITPTTSRTIRIRYSRSIPDMTVNSALYLPDCREVMVAGICAMCCASRGEATAAQYFESQYQTELDTYLRSATRMEQRRPRRRKPYSWMKTFRG